jgi:hypothetical protein
MIIMEREREREKFQMLLVEVLQLVTLQQGVWFGEGGRERSYCYCAAGVVDRNVKWTGT